MFSQHPQLLPDKPLPKHIAIIMDGNRRWYRNNALHLKQQNTYGHSYGAQVLPNILKEALSIGIQTLTVFAFSTENFSRSKEEVNELFSLFRRQLLQQPPFLKKHQIRVRFIGNQKILPKDLQEQMKNLSKETSTHQKLELIIAINYGGRDEIVRMVKNVHQDLLQEKISLNDVSERLIDSYLDTCGIQDPDLLIRTGGEMRVSNFLLWQIAYTELYITDVLWPDFQPIHLLDAIKSYQLRSIRKGK